MQYLFQVAIGPVQGFIASARRSRDLWFGSRLLSEVSKIAALTIYTIANEDNEILESSLIFPAPKSPDELKELEFGSDLNVANKIVACITIPDNSQEQIPTILENLGEAIRANIKKRLDIIKEQVYENIRAKKAGDNAFNEDRANAQITDLVELSWAAVPYEGQYNEARKKLDRLMAARKNTRDFRQASWGSEQLKSSIDGQLEGVIDKSFYPRDDKEKPKKAKELYRIFHAGPHERLSGVDLLKRLGTFPGKENFLSTSHIAAIPYLERLEHTSMQEEVRPALQKYIDEVQKVLGDELDLVPKGYKNYSLLGKYDGALFYPERHLDKLIKGKDLKNAQQELQSFFKLVKDKLQGATPSPYYAIICADGDRMGELIDTLAGDKEGERKHRELSQALDGFSRKVKEIVENEHIVEDKNAVERVNYKGALIYAGGDDVLAFLPLHSALNCAKELEKTFRNHLQPHAGGLDEEKKPSLSVGIAIVHHLTMLHEALNLARAAETKAKGVKGKNALAITVNKRSGEQYTVAGSWETLYPTLKQFIDYFRRDYLPRGVAYELRATQERLTMIDAKKSDDAQKQDRQETSKQEQDGQRQEAELSDMATLKAIMHLEAKRILRRKLNLPQSKLIGNASAEERQKQAKIILNTLLARIEGISESSKKSEGETTQLDPTTKQEATAKVPLAEFIQELIVAQDLAAAITLAEGKPPTEAQSKEGNVQ